MSDLTQGGIALFDPFSTLTVSDVMGGTSVNKQNLVLNVEHQVADPILMRLALATKREFMTIHRVGPSMSIFGRLRLAEWLDTNPRSDEESPMECLVRIAGERSPMIMLFAQIDMTHPLDAPDDDALTFVIKMLCTAFDDERLSLAEVASLSKPQRIDSVFEAFESSPQLLHEENLFDLVETGLARLEALIDAYDAVKREQQAALAVTMG